MSLSTKEVNTVAVTAEPVDQVAPSPDGSVVYAFSNRLTAQFGHTDGEQFFSVNLGSGALTTLSTWYWNDSGIATPWVALEGFFDITPDGATLVVSSRGLHCVSTISISTGEVTLLAGVCDSSHTHGSQPAAVDGFGTNARFDSPKHVAVSNDGNTAYVLEQLRESRVRSIDLSTGEVAELFLIGPADSAVWDLQISNDDSVLYYAYSFWGSNAMHIKAYNLDTLSGTTVSGTGGGNIYSHLRKHALILTTVKSDDGRIVAVEWPKLWYESALVYDIYVPGTCLECQPGTFSLSSTCTSCPADSDSPARSDDVTDCQCNAGFYGYVVSLARSQKCVDMYSWVLPERRAN
jgi:hypothetical protein